MNVAAVMQEIADRLDTIDGLNVHGYPALRITVPAATVLYPEDYTYDGTYSRGMDQMTVRVAVFVNKATGDERTTRDRLSAYLNGSGPASVKAVLEADTYESLDVLRVVSADLDVYTMNGADYLVAVFELEISGQGV